MYWKLITICQVERSVLENQSVLLSFLHLKDFLAHKLSTAIFKLPLGASLGHIDFSIYSISELVTINSLQFDLLIQLLMQFPT